MNVPPNADRPDDVPDDVPDSEAPMSDSSETLEPDDVTLDSGAPDPAEVAEESVTSPAKVMRIGSMVKQLLEEVRAAPLDEASRERLAEIYERSVTELAEALSPDLQEELRTLALPFDDVGIPSEAELRIAKAQLVGWLEGLFHGIQATLMAQQVAAQRQLQEMRQLPGGSPIPQHLQESGPDRPGTYL